MAQSNFISTRQDPRWLYSCAAILLIATTIGFILNQIFPPKAQDLVKWRSLSEYQSEAERTNKPVLFVFSARWCRPCKKMESEAFASKNISDTINRNYIPVMILDEKQEQGKNPPQIEKLQKTCAVDGFPTMIVVPSNLLGGSTKDIYSTGSRAEYDLVLKMLWPSWFESEEGNHTFTERFQEEYLDNNHGRIPAITGYGGIKSVEDYFWKCKIWHKLRLSRGDIHWQQIDKIGASKKPTLIALVEDCGYSSDKIRLGFFEDEKASAFINKDFNPVLLEFKRGPLANNDPKMLAIKARYKIQALPALVVVNANRQPEVQDGFTSSEHSMQFLKRALQD